MKTVSISFSYKIEENEIVRCISKIIFRATYQLINGQLLSISFAH